MPWYIVQLIGVAAIVCILISFQSNKRSEILLYLFIGQILFGVHFGLLGAWTAVATNVIAALRGAVYYGKPHYRLAQSKLWVYGFVGVVLLAGVLTYQGWYSVLITGAMAIETVALWSNNPKYIRLALLGIRPLFFIYSFIVGSYAGMIADVVFSISIIVGMYRFDKKNSSVL